MQPFIIDKLRKQKEKFKDTRPRLYIPEIDYTQIQPKKIEKKEEKRVIIIPLHGEDSEER